MGFIGYYMKKDKWWGILILGPMLLFLGMEYSQYLSETTFSFPRHLLTTIFCAATLIIYPLAIFNNKFAKYSGLVVSILIIIGLSILCIIKPPIYSTQILSNGEKYTFDDSYNVYLKDKKYGDVKIIYENGIEDWMVQADFKKSGKTELVLESPDGEKTIFNVSIRRDKYDIEEKK